MVICHYCHKELEDGKDFVRHWWHHWSDISDDQPYDDDHYVWPCPFDKCNFTGTLAETAFHAENDHYGGLAGLALAEMLGVADVKRT